MYIDIDTKQNNNNNNKKKNINPYTVYSLRPPWKKTYTYIIM